VVVVVVGALWDAGEGAAPAGAAAEVAASVVRHGRGGCGSRAPARWSWAPLLRSTSEVAQLSLASVALACHREIGGNKSR
jgi:hypothetical protein